MYYNTGLFLLVGRLEFFADLPDAVLIVFFSLSRYRKPHFTNADAIAAGEDVQSEKKNLQGRMNAHGETPFPSRVEYIHVVSLLFSKSRASVPSYRVPGSPTTCRLI